MNFCLKFLFLEPRYNDCHPLYQGKTLKIAGNVKFEYQDHWVKVKVFSWKSGLQITENHQESPYKKFRVVCESPRIISENFQSGLQITKYY